MKRKAVFASVLCFVAAAILGQGRAQQQPVPEKQVNATEIPGVIAAGTKVERVWTGLNAGDGLIAEPNGTLLLPEQGEANTISRVDKNAKVTLYLEDTNEAGGVAIDPRGRVIDIERKPPSRIRLLVPERKILADNFEGKPFQRLSDIVADKKGGVWITESPSASVFYLSACSNLGIQVFSPKGEHLGLIPIPRPTTTLAFAGPDKKTLYVIARGNDGPGGNGQNARSMYKIAMIAQGYKGRSK